MSVSWIIEYKFFQLHTHEILKPISFSCQGNDSLSWDSPTLIWSMKVLFVKTSVCSSLSSNIADHSVTSDSLAKFPWMWACWVKSIFKVATLNDNQFNWAIFLHLPDHFCSWWCRRRGSSADSEIFSSWKGGDEIRDLRPMIRQFSLRG